MNKRKKIIISFSILGAFIFVSFAFFLSSDGDRNFSEFFSPFQPRCDGTLNREIRSPDGKYIAGTFTSSCGATTPFYSHVNLRKTDEIFKRDKWGRYEKGRICVVDGKYSPTIVWISNSEISIEYPDSDNGKIIYESAYSGVNIKCKLIDNNQLKGSP